MPTVTYGPWTGVNLDAEPERLGGDTLSAAHNVRLREGGVEPCRGPVAYAAPAPNAPDTVMWVPPSYWLAMSGTSVYAWNGSVWTDITQSGVTYGAVRWTGGILGGVPVVNGGDRAPQYWPGPSTSNRLQDIPAWPANTTAAVLRPYRNFLFAADVTASGSRNPHLLKWSHAAAPGALPTSWDPNDPATDANEVELSDVGSGAIKDMLPLGPVLAVYKERSVWTARLTEVPGIPFALDRVLEGVGVPAPDCAAPVANGRAHVFFTGDDWLLWDGTSVRSLVEGRARRWLRSNLDTARFGDVRVAVLAAQAEAVLSFRATDGRLLMLAWHWPGDTLAVREYGDYVDVRAGYAPVGALPSWDAFVGTWDEAKQPWNRGTEPLHLVGLRPDGQLEAVEAGEYLPGRAARAGLRTRWPRVLVREMRPDLDGTADVRVGVMESAGQEPAWEPPVALDGAEPGAKVDVAVSGRFLAFEVAGSGGAFRLGSVGFVVEPCGSYP